MTNHFAPIICWIRGHTREDIERGDGRHCGRCGKLLDEEELSEADKPPSILPIAFMCLHLTRAIPMYKAIGSGNQRTLVPNGYYIPWFDESHNQRSIPVRRVNITRRGGDERTN